MRWSSIVELALAKVYYKPVEKFHTAAAHDLLFRDQEWRPDL